jgi:outer membrane receptor for ferrienterochelin and colicins
MRLTITVLLIFNVLSAVAQDKCIKGQIQFKDEMIPFAVITIKELSKSTVSNSEGKFEFLSLLENQYTITIHALGYKVQELVLPSQPNNSNYLPIELLPDSQVLGDLVISGTLKATSKMDSPIAVDVYSSTFFKRNSTSTLFDALQHINGVRPQINCNVCNTGSIHINGLDGPYTMVLINGMPIVSGLATVYGLSGIPQSLIERIEVIKGPSSTLYGSEALGGVINIITKNPKKAARFNLITSVNSWQEKNNDISISAPINRRVHTLMGINSYRYQNPIDNNGDGFTDLSLQNRISVFNSWQFTHGKKGKTQVSGRYIFEDRWGGEMNWRPKFAGGDSIYGEWIKTKRWEVFGSSELPLKEEVSVQWSFNNHNQKSYYGLVMFDGEQRNTFAQITWRKCISANDRVC